MSLSIAAILLASSISHAACPATSASLQADVEAAIGEYVDLTSNRFPEMFHAIEADLTCLTEPLSAPAAARLHLAYALDAWLDKERGRVYSSLRGAVVADRDVKIEDKIAQPGSSMAVLLQTARDARSSGASAPAARPVWIDGTPDQQAIPTDRAALVQRQEPDGSLRTWYLTGEGVPPELIASEAAEIDEPEKKKRPLLWTGLGVGAAAGASLALAANTRGSFNDLAHTDANVEEAKSLYGWNQALGYTGYGLAVVSGGLVVGALIQGRW